MVDSLRMFGFGWSTSERTFTSITPCPVMCQRAAWLASKHIHPPRLELGYPAHAPLGVLDDLAEQEGPSPVGHLVAPRLCQVPVENVDLG